MSKKYTVSYNESLVWPNECIVCGNNDVIFIKTTKAVTTGIFPFIFWMTIKSRSLTMSYPVCNRHKISIKFIIPFFFLIALILLITIGSALINYGMSAFLISLFLLLLIFSLLFIYRNLQPFYIAKVGTDFVSFVIKNDDYANKLENNNINILSEPRNTAES